MAEITIDYEAIGKRALSYSSLKEFAKSPEHFIKYISERKAPTPAMIFGSLLDSLILTPDTWGDTFVVKPEKPPYLKDLEAEHGKIKGREMYEANKVAEKDWIAANQGKTFIDAEDLEKAKKIAEKVFNHPPAMEILNQLTQTQETIYFVDPITKLKVVCKLDGRGENLIMDLKSTTSADPDDFIKSCLNFDYDLQAGVYCEGVAKKEFNFPPYYFLAVETSAPYGISICRASDEFIERGKLRLRSLLDNFKYCLDNKLFHQSYEFRSKFGPHILELPKWAKISE